MIIVRQRKYELKETLEVILSRLAFEVETVQGFAGPLPTMIKLETEKSWLGTFDKSGLKFWLMEPRGFFDKGLFQVIVNGEIIPEGNSNSVSINLRMGWGSLIMFFGCYMWLLFFLLGLILEYSEPVSGSIVIISILIPILITNIFIRKLNNVESRVAELFGVRLSSKNSLHLLL